jgi:hypothetical protein
MESCEIEQLISRTEPELLDDMQIIYWDPHPGRFITEDAGIN